MVRGGIDAPLPPVVDKETGERRDGNTFPRVHTEMLHQVLLDYGGLGDWRALTASEIRFFYDGIRGSLKRSSAKKK